MQTLSTTRKLEYNFLYHDVLGLTLQTPLDISLVSETSSH